MIVRWTKLAAANLAHICDYTEKSFRGGAKSSAQRFQSTTRLAA
jgi:hypothetical protein